MIYTDSDDSQSFDNETFSILIVGSKRSESWKIRNLVLNWCDLFKDALLTVIKALQHDIDHIGIALIVFAFCIDICSHTCIRLSVDHGLVYWHLWNSIGNRNIVCQSAILQSLDQFYSNKGKPMIPISMVETIINDLQQLHSLQRLPNGDLRLFERLEVRLASD